MIEEHFLRMGHIPKIRDFKVEEPKFSKPLDVFTAAHAKEQEYKKLIGALVERATKEGDQLTLEMLMKMFNEQVDSCNEFDLILKQATAFSTSDALFYQFDAEMGKK